MTIEKNEKIYSVKENIKSWTVSRKSGITTINFSVPKSQCADFAALKEYIASNDLF